MADRRTVVRRRAFVAAMDVWNLAALLGATVRLAREMEPGSRPSGLTLSTWTRSREAVVYRADLSQRPVGRMVETYSPDGPVLWDLAVPDTAEGAQDV